MEKISKLFDSLLEKKCTGNYNIVTRKCLYNGKWTREDGIIICDHLSEKTRKETIVHELIHAYDECLGMDFNSIRDVACSEIRAASLSGDCDWDNELMRGNLPFHKRCCKRRAKLSLILSGFDSKQSDDAINSVFDKCYQNKTPFEL